jgi:SAM-dependent methyltransferase
MSVAGRSRDVILRLLAGRLAKGEHLTRYAMYQRLRSLAVPIKPDDTALAISGSEYLCQVLGFGSDRVVSRDYPECSITNLPFEDAVFDVVVSDQVLEHVEGDPRQAIEECMRVLRPGGLCVHTTCLINPIHYGPKDLWRFSPDGLRHLIGADAEVLECDGWGNRLAVVAMALGLRKLEIPHARWHPFHRLATRSDPNWLIVTWIVARKRSTEAAG